VIKEHGEEERPSYIVASFLQLKGYRIIPVRPSGPDILGEKAYPQISWRFLLI
jgi:predicted CoA-binding protein